MTFKNLQPNGAIPLASVRVGSTSDARWRDVPDDVERIDSAHRVELGHAERSA